MIVPRPELLPESEAIYMIVKGNEIMQSNESGALPCMDAIAIDHIWQQSEFHAEIGTYQHTPVYMLSVAEECALEGFQFAPLRQLLRIVDAEMFALAGRACQVAYFIRSHNFCSYCGDALTQVEDELAVYCSACDYRTYPRISPCIIVAVYRERNETGEILLAQGVRHPEGLYSVLAGFVESGESLEQTLVREVFEETGVTVDNLEYIRSQPWPFPHSLMMGFTARYCGGALVIDEKEIVTADWFSFDELPKTPPPGTIAAALIEAARIRAKA